MVDPGEVPRRISEQCLLMRSRRLARIVTQIYAEPLAAHGLSVAQFTLLSAIGSTSGVRAADLSPALDLEKSTVSRELRTLLRDGLLDEQPLDGRSRVLSLTDAGRERLEEAFPTWREAQVAAEDALGRELPRLLRELFPR